MENGLFLFHRDLRLIDNIGLYALRKKVRRIFCVFIFTPEQVVSNPYKSVNAVQFMMESLDELRKDIESAGGTFLFCYGNTSKVLKYLVSKLDIHAVGYNLDYSPYALARDKDIAEFCKKENIGLIESHDYYLHVPGSILNGSGETYQKFTPYYEKASKVLVSPVKRKVDFDFAKISNRDLSYRISYDVAFRRFVGNGNPNLLVKGGRQNGLSCIRAGKRNARKYSDTRDMVSLPTSQLSAYIKFGCVSIREVYFAFRPIDAFVRQLYWRDFYANILYAYPHVLGASMKPKYDKIKWRKNSVWFDKWCKGETGFPIVDAGMRQMNQTGYMHNRARLIVMSFLIKTLLIDWKLGEEYFARKLTDYDPASNNGNIQWVMGGGSDSNPYFRIFNPWNQTLDYDPECVYIKKWLPMLKDVVNKDILKWYDEWSNYDVGYFKPIVDYSAQRDKALVLYKSGLN